MIIQKGGFIIMLDKNYKTERVKRTPDKNIANRLKSLREANKLSRQAVAKKLKPYVLIKVDGETGRALISNLEKGKQNLTIELSIAYSKVFNVSLEYILCLSDDMQPENRGIKDVLGLSDISIKKIEKLKKSKLSYEFNSVQGHKPPLLKILNKLFEEGFLTEILETFDRFLYDVIVINEMSCGHLSNRNVNEERKVLLPARWSLDREVSQDIDKVIKSLLMNLSDYYESGVDTEDL